MTALAPLIATHSHNGQRVFSIDHEGQRLWVKRGSKDYCNRMTKFLGVLSDHVLRRNRTIHPRLQRELYAISALRSSGILVPQVIETQRNAIVLEDIGPSLQQLFYAASQEERATLLTRAALALRQLHRAGHWHGAANLKNITLNENEKIGFIDFENTVHCWLGHRGRHAYDIWQLASSAARYDRSGETAATVFRAYGDEDILMLINRITAYFRPLYTILLKHEHRLPRDVWQTMATMRGLWEATNKSKSIR